MRGRHGLSFGNAPDALNILLESIAEKKLVVLHYHSAYAEESTSRTIEPVGLFNEGNYWYAMGYCHLRKNYRQFRIDRVLQIKRTDLPFTKEHEGNLDAFRKIKDSPEKTKVVIRVDKNIVKYIRTGRKYYGFVSEKVIGDRIEMTFLTTDLHNEMPRWYLMFSDCSEIVEPEIFRHRVNELLEKAKSKLGMNNSQIAV